MKTAIITGAAGNLGRVLISKFLENGYYVAGTVVPGHKTAININHENFTTFPVDVSNEEAAEKFVTDLASNKESIDVAVLTVGGFDMGNIEETKSSDIARQYQLNFETAYNVARPVFMKMMQQESGRIFLVGSKPGYKAANSKGMIAYGLAKSLLFRLAELMNDEAKGKNIVTSVVVPSTIDTPQNRLSMPGADFSKWVNPAAIADVICYYCSDEAAVLREPVIKVYNES